MSNPHPGRPASRSRVCFLRHASDPHTEYLALVDELTEHDRRYYVEANPTISDVEYDRLSQRLRAIEAEHRDWVVAWLPSQRVGHAPVSDFPKVHRLVAMLSLDNTYDEAELRAFFDRVVKVTPTGSLSRVGRVCSRASTDSCSKIFAMRSRSSACRASGASPSGSGAPYTQ